MLFPSSILTRLEEKAEILYILGVWDPQHSNALLKTPLKTPFHWLSTQLSLVREGKGEGKSWLNGGRQEVDRTSLWWLLISPWSRRAEIYRSISSVQSLSHVWLFVTPWTAAHQVSLSITNSQSLLKLMSIELLMPSNHLIFCRPLSLPPLIFPSIRVFSNESVLLISCQSFGVSASADYIDDIIYKYRASKYKSSPNNTVGFRGLCFFFFLLYTA